MNKKSVLGVGAAAGVAAAVAAGVALAGSFSGGTTAAGHPSLSVATASDASVLSSPGGADSAMAAPMITAQPTSYAFRTVDDRKDPTFNQLLGINDSGVIAGYFGSGAAGHPNKGYTVTNHATTFVDENVTHSVQTQVTGINNNGTTVGFSSAANNANQVNDNTGFVARRGVVRSVAFPAKSNATPPVNQLLGVNDDQLAVGFYADAAGNDHGYTYDVNRGTFHAISVPGSTSDTAAAINDRDEIAGFDTASTGQVEGFLRESDGRITHLAVPGASMTQALGVDNRGEVVGAYQVGTGDNAVTHGFTWTAHAGFRTVDAPAGAGGTTINGLNDAGVLVGFYTDAAGNTHGLVAVPSRTTPPTPGRSVTEKVTLSAMPSGTVAVSRTAQDHYRATIDAYGFTPGSAHVVEIDVHGTPAIRFGSVTADTAGRISTSIVSTDADRTLPAEARFVIRLGANTGDFNRNALAAEVIAQSAPLPAVPTGVPYRLTSVDQNTAETDLGHLSGSATIHYDASAHTLTVTVNATGLSQGNHAAHVHSGTCGSQGPVQYMLMDYTANANGAIVNQTRTVTGVTSMPAAGTWYLNLHQGDSNSIVVNGQPALSFRPLLCANG